MKYLIIAYSLILIFSFFLVMAISLDRRIELIEETLQQIKCGEIFEQVVTENKAYSLTEKGCEWKIDISDDGIKITIGDKSKYFRIKN